MSYENRKDVIINASEVSSVDFSQVIETSADTLRWSLDGEQTFVKFDEDNIRATPSFLSGKTQYNYSQIRTILEEETWSE